MPFPLASSPRVFHHQTGFNLVELLLVLLVGGLLLGVALPAGQGILERGQLIGATNETYATLLFARSEAMRRRQAMSVCAVTSLEAENCSASSQALLAVFRQETTGAQLATGRTNPIELNAPASVRLHNVENNRLVFERLGNRQAGVTQGQPVYLEVAVNNRVRIIDVCFNGRIMIREQNVSQSGCQP